MKTFRELFEAFIHDAYARNGHKYEGDPHSFDRVERHPRETRDHIEDLAKKLERNDLGEEHAENVLEYTGHNEYSDTTNSAPLNKHLIRYGKPSPEHEHIHQTIMEKSAPSGHEVHLYSGTGTDFGHLAEQSKSRILHSHAHISATHDPQVARKFASNSDNMHKMHIVHIHVKPHDKILHVSHHSEEPSEYETIIPAGTKLKYHGSTNHEKSGSRQITEHHFTIHSQP